MKTPPLTPRVLFAFMTLLLWASVSHAQVYKCVDENGRTHYSENADACKSNAAKVKVNTPSGPTQSPEAAATQWGEQERLRKQRQLKEEYNAKKYESQENLKPKSLSGGRAGNTDQSKCNLARDILNGSVVHPNGKPTDDYDRRVAQRDVEKYCGN